MKWTSALLAVLALFCGVVRADDLTFTQKLSPEELHRAGLDKLTPEERAVLDQLVATQGTKTVVKEVVRTVTVVQETEPTPTTVTKRASEATSAQEGGGWINWLKPKSKPKSPDDKKEEKDSAASTPLIESEIAGNIHGWDAHTIFTLANGQKWAVSDYSTRNFVHALDSPKVTITPSGVFGFILYFPDVDEKIRVRPMN